MSSHKIYYSFRDILNEVSTEIVPARYIHYITFMYDDNTEITVPGDMVFCDVSINAIPTQDDIFTGAKVVSAKVVIDAENLEHDVTCYVNCLFDKHYDK